MKTPLKEKDIKKETCSDSEETVITGTQDYVHKKQKQTQKDGENGNDSDETIITGTQEYVHKKQIQTHKDGEDIQEANSEPSESLLKRKKKKKKSLELSQNEMTEGHFERTLQSTSMLSGVNEDIYEFTTADTSSSLIKVKKKKKKKRCMSQAQETLPETERSDFMDAFMTDDSSVNSDKVTKRKKKKSSSCPDLILEIEEPPIKKKKIDSVDLFTQDIFKQPSLEDFVNSTPKKRKKKNKELSLNDSANSDASSLQEVDLNSSVDSQNGITVLKKKKKKKEKLNLSQNDDSIEEKSEDNSSINSSLDSQNGITVLKKIKKKKEKLNLSQNDDTVVEKCEDNSSINSSLDSQTGITLLKKKKKKKEKFNLSENDDTVVEKSEDNSSIRLSDPAHETTDHESSEHVIGKKKRKKKRKSDKLDDLSQSVIDLEEQDNNSEKNISDSIRIKEKSSKEKNSEGDILLDPGKIKREKESSKDEEYTLSLLNSLDDVELNGNSQLNNDSSNKVTDLCSGDTSKANRVNDIAEDTDSEIDFKKVKKKKKNDTLVNDPSEPSCSGTSKVNNDDQRHIGVKEKKSKKNSVDRKTDDILLDPCKIKDKKESKQDEFEKTNSPLNRLDSTRQFDQSSEVFDIDNTNFDTSIEEGYKSHRKSSILPSSSTVKRKIKGEKGIKDSSKANSKSVSASNLLDNYLEKVNLNDDTQLTNCDPRQEMIHDSSGFSSAVSEIQENESKEACLKTRRNKRNLHEIINDIIKDLGSNDDSESASDKKTTLNKKSSRESSVSSIQKREKEEMDPKADKKKSKDKILLGLGPKDVSVNDINGSPKKNTCSSMEFLSSDFSDVKKENSNDSAPSSKSFSEETKSEEAILRIPEKKSKNRFKVKVQGLVSEGHKTKIKKWRKENSSSPSLSIGDAEVKNENLCNSPLSIKSNLSFSDTETKPKDTSNNSSGLSNANDAYFCQSDTSDTDIDDKLYKLDVMRAVLKSISILVDFEVPRLHQICNRASQPTPMQKMQLQSENISVKNGKFLKAEDDQIIANYKEFIRMHNIEDIPELFTSLDKKYIKAEEKQNFLFFLSKNLPDRTPFSVYQRFKILLVHVKKGRFTEEEDKYILEKMEETACHRNFAVEIADHLKRPLEAIQKRVNRLKDLHTRKIRWRKRNLAPFIRYLLKVTRTSEENIEQLKNRHITSEEWTRLSKKLDKVPVRILKRAWLVKIHPALFIPGVCYDLREVKLKLIELFHKNKEHDWRSVNWKKYVTHFDGLTCLRIYTIFKTMVISRIPSELRKDLKTCIKILRNVPPEDISRRVIYKIQYKNGEIIELGSKTKEEKS